MCIRISTDWMSRLASQNARQWSRLAALACALFLVACVPSKTVQPSHENLGYQTSDTLPGKVHLRQGQELLKELAKGGSNTARLQTQAHLHFSEAYARLPNSLAVLDGLYRTQFTLDFSTGQASEKLRALYQQFPASMRADYSSPDYINAIAKLRNGQVDEAQALLIRVLTENPNKSEVWKILASIHNAQKRPSLAYFGYSQAAKWEESEVLYVRLAKTLEALASKQGCYFDSPGLINKAAAHYVRAGAISSNVEHYKDATYNYLDTGRIPLALHAANAAKGIDLTGQAQWLQAEISIARGKYQEALKWMKESEALDSDNVSTLDAALIHIALEQDEQALVYLNDYHYQINGQPFTLSVAIKNWLYALLEQPEHKPLDLTSVQPEYSWHQTVRSYLLGDKPDSSLIDAANDGCESTEAYFYTAYLNWKHGDREKAKKLLRQTLDQPANTYVEWTLAKVLLERL